MNKKELEERFIKRFLLNPKKLEILIERIKSGVFVDGDFDDDLDSHKESPVVK